MNRQRRKAIDRQHDIIGEAIEALRDLCAEEQAYLDAMPENLAMSDRRRRRRKLLTRWRAPSWGWRKRRKRCRWWREACHEPRPSPWSFRVLAGHRAIMSSCCMRAW